MSKDIASQPLQSRVAILVVCLLCIVIGGGIWLWWQGKGPFSKPVTHLMPLGEETEIYFVYDDKDTHLEPLSMVDNLYNRGPVISVSSQDKSVPFSSLLTGRNPETLPDAKTLSDIDAEIRQSIRQVIQNAGLQPRELPVGKEPATFWNDASVKPFRLLVHVKKRFEKDKCSFWVNVELQEGARLSASPSRSVYVTMFRSSSLKEVRISKVKQAIGKKVTADVKHVFSNGLGGGWVAEPEDEE